MTKSLLISALPGEYRAALADAGELVDFRLARIVGASHAGEIFLGRVVALRPALRAALIDIGLDRPAYLSADDIVPRGALASLQEGAAITVQVKRDARADKGAAVTMRVTFRDATSRSAIEEASRNAKPPCCLDSVPPLEALLADLIAQEPDTILIDDMAAYAELRLWLGRFHPALAPRLQSYRGDEPIFSAYGVADAIEELFGRQVSLPGGAKLVIETLAAATLIDVDSGSLSDERKTGEEAFLVVDLAAASECVRQIRLRGLAGALVVDFIPLRRTAARVLVLEALRSALSVGAPDVQLLGWTKLGHMEMTRPRRRAPLHDIVFERNPQGGWVKTGMTVALEALAAAARQAAISPSSAPVLHLHPAIVAILDGEAAPARHALEARLGQALSIVPEPGRSSDSFTLGGVRPI